MSELIADSTDQPTPADSQEDYLLWTPEAATVYSIMNEQVNAWRHQANHDRLTGLPNKAVWAEDIERRMHEGQTMIIAFLDMDAFKLINDTFGHQRGDEMLVSFANHLKTLFRRESDVLTSRWGGDEYGITACLDIPNEATQQLRGVDRATLQPQATEERAATFRSYLEGGIAEFISSQDENIRRLGFGISFGTVYWQNAPTDAQQAEEIIDQVDAAMYEQKRARKSLGSVPTTA